MSELHGFSGLWDVLDEMYGALGSASLKVGVVGEAFTEVNPITKHVRHLFHAEKVGFYIRDHYDFNGLQYLGTWTEDRVLTQVETAFTLSLHGQLVLRLKDGPFIGFFRISFIVRLMLMALISLRGFHGGVITRPESI